MGQADEHPSPVPDLTAERQHSPSGAQIQASAAGREQKQSSSENLTLFGTKTVMGLCGEAAPATEIPHVQEPPSCSVGTVQAQGTPSEASWKCCRCGQASTSHRAEASVVVSFLFSRGRNNH